ncbi:MAG TPA: hypothetical protein VFS36_12095 [Chitinophagaceae bacterium]|nr:hypothetical protein [Chitinophagaceae bacterium]
MSTYSIQDIIQSTDRYKLYTLMCSQDGLEDCISWLYAKKIHTINLGKELAAFIDSLDDFSYLNIDVFDYTKKLLDKHKTKINNPGNDVVAIHNLGILLEPALELNATQLLKEFSKTAALIIIWENQSDIPDRLHWSTQQNNIFLDFTETPLKKLQYAI